METEEQKWAKLRATTLSYMTDEAYEKHKAGVIKMCTPGPGVCKNCGQRVDGNPNNGWANWERTRCNMCPTPKDQPNPNGLANLIIFDWLTGGRFF
jgi:hypothetical protein